VAVEAALVALLTRPRPPGDQEYFHQIPSMPAFCRIRSAVDLGVLATLHWRATKRDVALFSTRKPFHGYCRRAVQAALLRLQGAGFIARVGKYAFRVHKGPGSPVRASFLAAAREGAGPEMGLAVRLVAALGAGICGDGQRALKKALCVSDEMATFLSGTVRRHADLLSGVKTAPSGAVFILRTRRGAPNRSPFNPDWCPESCAINDLTFQENQSSAEDAVGGPIDTLYAESRKILPLAEVETLRAALKRLWDQTPQGYSALQLMRHGLDIYLSRGAAPIANLEGYLFLALSRRRPQDPTPALDRAIAAQKDREGAKEREAAAARARAEREAEGAAAVDALVAAVERVYPDFRSWGVLRQGALFTSLGGNPLEALEHHDPSRFSLRHGS
jgi:hypothetical protein